MSRGTRLAVALLLAAAAAAAQAAPTTYVRFDTVYDLAPDGSWTEDRHLVVRINEQAAVNASSQVPLGYSKALQSVEVIEAYTTTRDGLRIDVPADRIITQQAPLSGGAAMYSDVMVRNILFPQVEVGATMTLRVRLRQHTPFLPGWFGQMVAFDRFADFEQASVTLRAPADMPVYVDAHDVDGGLVSSGTAGKREWRWTHGPSVGDKPEPGSLPSDSISPRVTISTLPDYPALAAAYLVGAAPAAKVTPVVRKLADEITRGVRDKRAQAEALYRWVSGEVRYVAIAMGTGGWVPHSADEVIVARYGDCKDKTTLLIALLAAKGIRGEPVLIYAGERRTLPSLPVMGAFNHAIAYLPEFDLYLDSTITAAPFNALPDRLRGQPVVTAGGAWAKPVVRQIPFSDPAQDRTIVRTYATISADGTISGTTSVEALGSQDADLRTGLSQQAERDLPQIARSWLAGTGQTGTATLKLGDLRDFTHGRLYSVDFTTPGRVSLPGPGALTGTFGAQSSSIRSFVAGVRQVERTLDFSCPSGAFEELLELTLPANMKIGALPGAAQIESPFGRFSASHEVQEGRLLIVRRLEIQRTRTVCNAADHVELRQFATAIDRELRRQVLYQ